MTLPGSIPVGQPQSLHAAVGGTPFFAALVRGFYDRVWQDEVLRPMYPQDDREGAEERLRLFLEQFFGGPTTYSETRGHPRLRMRHAPFPVDLDARDRWLAAMEASVDDLAPAPLHRAELMDYFERAATAMLNRNPLFR
ncbi:globin [Agrococcus terreus]|uniref:Group 2 truncated hemoglobin GlbO n=1 Tax=Agrococcus terreus TaxID=574649 RepID=A0ABQ2KLB1_9MICO|nr:globin [Agrococcus terreus]GGN85451.1 group 2 truncated hemoglobin GlbO [Agrococcus terreus]